MRPIEMNRTGMLGAAIYAALEDRHSRNMVIDFSVRVELIPALAMANEDVVLGSRISGYIQTKSIGRRDFVIDFTCFGELRVEVSYRKSSYRGKSIACIDAKGPIEIDFDKRTIVYKHVYSLNLKNVSWGWQEVKGTAADIIGMIYSD